MCQAPWPPGIASSARRPPVVRPSSVRRPLWVSVARPHMPAGTLWVSVGACLAGRFVLWVSVGACLAGRFVLWVSVGACLANRYSICCGSTHRHPQTALWVLWAAVGASQTPTKSAGIPQHRRCRSEPLSVHTVHMKFISFQNQIPTDTHTYRIGIKSRTHTGTHIAPTKTHTPVKQCVTL